MQAGLQRVTASDAGRRIDRRRHHEFILDMASHLTRGDRMMIELIYRDGRSAAEVACLSRRHVRTVQSRSKAVVKRIYSRDFQYLVAHESLLPRDLQASARRLILEGRGLRGTARLTGHSLHVVRRHQIQIKALLRVHADAWSPPSDSPARQRPVQPPS